MSSNVHCHKESMLTSVNNLSGSIDNIWELISEFEIFAGYYVYTPATTITKLYFNKM